MDAAARAREDEREREFGDELAGRTAAPPPQKRELLQETHYVAISAAMHYAQYRSWEQEQEVYTKGGPNSWRGLGGKQVVSLVTIYVPLSRQHYLGSDGYVYCRDANTQRLYQAELRLREPGDITALKGALQEMIDSKAYRSTVSN